MARPLDEGGLALFPEVDASCAELSLLDEHIESGVARTGPRVAHRGRGDAEENVLERPVGKVVIRPDRSFEGRGHEARPLAARGEVLADVSRLHDDSSSVVDQDGHENVAASRASKLVAVAVRDLHEVVARAQEVEHHLHLSGIRAVPESEELAMPLPYVARRAWTNEKASGFA